MQILITGAAGFVGGHLAARLLRDPANAVFGLSRRGVWPAAWAAHAGRVPLHAVDLHDAPRLTKVLAEVRPDVVYHLAGYANTGKSFKEPAVCWRDNLDATRNLYDALHAAGLRPRVLYASTGLVYGEAESGEPIAESAVLRPASPYAASKAAADLLSYQVARTQHLNVVRVRLFNQIGPHQSADYAVANFARQIAAIEAGKQPPVLETGDLSGRRDLTDVRDMAAALTLLAERGVAGEVYNAGRGETWRIGDVLNQLLALSRVPIEVREKAPADRAADTAVTRADPAKLHAATGWAPAYELPQTLADTLAAWRAAPGEPAT